MRRLGLATLGALIFAAPAEAAPPKVAPEVGGVLLVSTSSATADDPRLGPLAAGFARRGLESFAGGDLVRPPLGAEQQVIRARRNLEEARSLRRKGRLPEAAQRVDEAIRAFERAASEPLHLALLVEALVDRGAIAVEESDQVTAETVFLTALGFDPLYEIEATTHGDAARSLFAEVRRAARQLPLGILRVEVPDVPGAEVAVDFGAAHPAPHEFRIADGRHFLTVSAPGRHEVVTMVRVRAERQASVVSRPPLAGDQRARAQALATLDPSQPERVVQLARAAGLRFVAGVKANPSQLEVRLLDGRTGREVAGAEVVLSGNAGPQEIDAAVGELFNAALRLEPGLIPDESPAWYGTWWGVTLLGAAVLGAAAATWVAVGQGGTEYRFVP